MNRYLSAIGLILLLVACAGKRTLYIKQDPKPRPSEGKVLVNFVRPHGIGYATRVQIWDGDKLIGISRRAHSFQYECSPGKHLFVVWSGQGSPLEANLTPDKIYYILLRNRPGTKNIYQIPLNEQHSLWEETLEWQGILPNYRYDQETLAYEQGGNRAAIQNYMLTYKNVGVMTNKISRLRPEDGVFAAE